MRKIRGFKLNLRLKEVQRRAKKSGVDLAAIGFLEPPDGGRPREASPSPLFQPYLDKVSAAMTPAVLFESFAQPDPAEAALLSPITGLAYSLVLATLGEGLEKVKQNAREEDPEKLPLLDVIEAVALEDALRFTTAILEQEASDEGCLLSPFTSLSDAAALELICRKLESSKIGVSLSEGKLAPAATLACSLSWLAKSKSKGKTR